MKTMLYKWVLGWSVAGLVVPVLLLLRCRLLGSEFGLVELVLWPSCVFLTLLEGTPRPIAKLIELYSATIVENIILYSLIGLFTIPIVYMVLRVRNRPS